MIELTVHLRSGAAFTFCPGDEDVPAFLAGVAGTWSAPFVPGCVEIGEGDRVDAFLRADDVCAVEIGHAIDEQDLTPDPVPERLIPEVPTDAHEHPAPA